MRDPALHWFLKSRSGEVTPAELEAWLDADPANRAEFDSVAATWEGIAPLADDPRLQALRRRVSTRRRFAAPAAMAASLAVASIGGLAWWNGGESLSNQQFQTDLGEQATVTLPDGSVVTLSTDTLVRTRKEKGRRLVYLERGQAYFDVAKDPRRPFVVHAAGRTVTALGTAFEVRVDRGFKVTLVEGKVRVAAPPAAKAPEAAVQEIVMTPGSQLSAAGETFSVGKADVGEATSWVRGQLVFVDEPLAAVAAEMNRFSDRKITVEGEAGGILISGTFKPGDVAGFVAAIEDYGLVAVASDTPGGVRLAELR